MTNVWRASKQAADRRPLERGPAGFVPDAIKWTLAVLGMPLGLPMILSLDRIDRGLR